MKIEADMRIVMNDTNTDAIGHVVIDEWLTIENVRLMRGKNGPFIALPSQKKGEAWVNVIETNEELMKKITEAVGAAVVKDATRDLFLKKDDFQVHVQEYIGSGESALKGFATLEKDGLKIKNIRIMENQKGDLFVSMPQIKRQNSESGEETWSPLVNIEKGGPQECVKQAILDKYQEVVSKGKDIPKEQDISKEKDIPGTPALKEVQKKEKSR